MPTYYIFHNPHIPTCIYREKPGSDEQKELEVQKVPLLLNFSQCKLLSGDWYEVIEHTTAVLKMSPGNYDNKLCCLRNFSNVRSEIGR